VLVRPGISQARICKTKSVIPLWSGKRTKIYYSFRTDDVLLKVRNRKERCYAGILDAATKSHPNPGLLLFSRHNWRNHYLVHAVFWHILAVGADSHAPTCLSSGPMCAWHHWPCTKAHLCSEVSSIGRCFPSRPCEQGSCILSWLVCLRISYLVDQATPSSRTTMVFFLIKVLCTNSHFMDFSSPINLGMRFL
jgi:hypothetical protein